MSTFHLGTEASPETLTPNLRAAALSIYMAGAWRLHDDSLSDADQAALWSALRDAIGLAPGTARSAGVAPALAIPKFGEAVFRLGAVAMRDAIVRRLGREWPGPAVNIAADVEPPSIPVAPPKPEAWAWWASTDEEFFTVGPCATRQIAIDEARNDFGGDGFHLIEARMGSVRFSADNLIETQYFECDDLFDCDHAEPDRTGGVEAIAAADAELQHALDAWLGRWGHTFATPNLFASTRNREWVAPVVSDGAEQAAE